jgi:hypothetical protein
LCLVAQAASTTAPASRTLLATYTPTLYNDVATTVPATPAETNCATDTVLGTSSAAIILDNLNYSAATGVSQSHPFKAVWLEFLEKVRTGKPEIDGRFQPPHLSKNSKFNLLLHWRPLRPWTPNTSILDYTNPCITWVRHRFPNLEQYSVHDLYCFQLEKYNDHGERKKDKELYGKDPQLPDHFDLAYRYIAEQPGIPILFGRPVLQWFLAEFNPVLSEESYHFEVNGVEVCVQFLRAK